MTDKEAHKLYMQTYQAENRERCNAHTRAWYYKPRKEKKANA